MSLNEAAEQEVLNRIAAIQAAVEILHDHQDMPRHERRRFLVAITEEAGRLSRMLQACPCGLQAAAH